MSAAEQTPKTSVGDRAGSSLSTDSTAIPPLEDLPRLSSLRARIDERLARLSQAGWYLDHIAARLDRIGARFKLLEPEIVWSASGLNRPGLIAQFSWSRHTTKFAIGIDTHVTHAIIDRSLGYSRRLGEEHYQLTPVEWGIGTFLIAELLDHLDEQAPSSLGPLDFVLDRVSPDPYQPDDLGSIVTLRWPIEVGPVRGSARLWIPQSLLSRWLADAARIPEPMDQQRKQKLGVLTGLWRAEAGALSLPKGLSRLRVGGVLPLFGGASSCTLSGTPTNLSGEVALALETDSSRTWFPAKPVTGSGGGRITITGSFLQIPIPRKAIPVSMPSAPATSAPTADIPVTLTVELGKLNLTLAKVADLKPGDVLELGRHSREPVELTSGGKLVARGELVQIDTELGVRIINIYL